MIKTHTHKSYLGKSIVGYFCREAILKKTIQSKKSKLSGSHIICQTPSVGWISWHASNYKPHSTFRFITNRHVNIYKLVWKLSCRGIQKLDEPAVARAYVAMYGTLWVTNVWLAVIHRKTRIINQDWNLLLHCKNILFTGIRSLPILHSTRCR